MYPKVTLKLNNHIANILYVAEKGKEKQLTFQNENIYEVVINLAIKLNLITNLNLENNSETLVDLLDLARESDELYITDLPEIEASDLEFNLGNILDKFLIEIKTRINEEYSGVEMSNELRDTINSNQNADIFASLLEVMYTILIAKTILAATELGIGLISLNDNNKNTRLQEKMAKELQNLGVEFQIDS